MTTPTNDVRDQVVAALMNNDPSRRKAGEIDLITVTLEGVNAVVDLIRQEKIKVLEEVKEARVELIRSYHKDRGLDYGLLEGKPNVRDATLEHIESVIQQLKEEA